MKKYFLLAISFLSFVFFFSFHHVQPTDAWAGEGQYCTIGIAASEENRCDANIHFCNLAEGDANFITNPASNQGRCRVKTVVDCACDGDKRILCGLPGQPKTIDTTCERSEDVCRTAAADFIGPEDRVNRIEVPATLDNGTERLRGISCEDPNFPECTCLGAGNAAASGQNGIQCKVGGVVVGEGYCKDNKACRSGGNLRESDVHLLLDNKGNDNRSLPTEDRDLRGKDLSGISCGAEQVQCECIGAGNVAASGQNGIQCKVGGVVVGEGYCKDNKACRSTGAMNENDVHRLVDNQLNNNTSLPNEDSSLNDKELTGVSCEALSDGETRPPPPPPPPPPLPPCKERGDNGVCATFATGFGDIGTETGAFIQSLFAILLSVSGGIALLLILKSGYQMMTSQGKPEQLQAGRDQLVAAIVGLVFLIFSFVILQIIGYDILKIPGFG